MISTSESTSESIKHALNSNKKMKYNQFQLDEMFKEISNVPKIYKPSRFWEDLSRLHISQILKGDLGNFKRTVIFKYFTWGILGIIRHQTRVVFSEFFRGNFAPLAHSQLLDHKPIKGVSNVKVWNSIIFRTFVAALFDYVSRIDHKKILSHINEPSAGNPIMIRYKNRLITQDLCNSVHEFYSSTQMLNLDKKVKIKIAEIGAGYGRLAYVFLTTLPHISYCIIDIPPALYIAQEYLSKILPGKKIFKFRSFNNFNDIRDEFNSSQVQFFMPHQIEHLPTNTFSLVISVSTLQEMTRPQIKNYIKQIDRLCSGYFYTKQWLVSRTKDNNFISLNEYPFLKKWKIVYRQRHPIQRLFFDALFKV